MVNVGKDASPMDPMGKMKYALSMGQSRPSGTELAFSSNITLNYERHL